MNKVQPVLSDFKKSSPSKHYEFDCQAGNSTEKQDFLVCLDDLWSTSTATGKNYFRLLGLVLKLQI